MPNETTYAGIVGDLQNLEAALAANAAEIPHLEPSRAILANLLSQAQDLTRQQAALTAGKQDATRQLQTTISDSQRLATILRKGLKQFYGIRSEKLAEFGLQPFRGRTTSKAAPQDPPTPTPPAAPAAR